MAIYVSMPEENGAAWVVVNINQIPNKVFMIFFKVNSLYVFEL